jgi:hypothetical protein
MATVKFSYVINQIEESGAKFWKLLDSDGKNVLARFQNEGKTIDESLEALRAAYENTSGDFVIITANIKPGSEIRSGGDNITTGYRWRVECFDKPQKAGAGAITGDLISLLRENAALQQEIAINKIRSEYESQQTEQGIAGPIYGILDKLADNPQVMGALAGLLNSWAKKKPAPVSSPGNMQAQAPAQITGPEILQKLSELDPDPVGTLEKMYEYFKSQPDPVASFAAVKNYLHG